MTGEVGGAGWGQAMEVCLLWCGLAALESGPGWGRPEQRGRRPLGGVRVGGARAAEPLQRALAAAFGRAAERQPLQGLLPNGELHQGPVEALEPPGAARRSAHVQVAVGNVLLPPAATAGRPHEAWLIGGILAERGTVQQDENIALEAHRVAGFESLAIALERC